MFSKQNQSEKVVIKLNFKPKANFELTLKAKKRH